MSPALAAPGRAAARVVRLNAELMPVSAPERRRYERFGLSPVEVEVADPAGILRHTAHAHAVCVVSASLPREVIDGLGECLLISRLGNGTDKIDVERATERGIVVANVPDFCIDEMAEHVMGMLLSFARALPSMALCMREGRFGDARAEALRLRRLSGRTLGLIGFGASARAVARRAAPFGLRLLATRRDLTRPDPQAGALGVDIVGLEDLLAASDFVSLHLPLTPQTRHLLDAEGLRRMRPGAVLINASRGEIVDEDALAERILGGHLAGAGLDTFGFVNVFGETETPPTHPLIAAGNVLATPHVSALSQDSTAVVARDGVRNLVSVLGGCLPPPENVVNPTVVPRAPLRRHDPSLFDDDPSDDEDDDR